MTGANSICQLPTTNSEMGLSDKMLATGAALHIEAIHGEPILILDGPDAGKTFIAVRETESDQVLTTDLGMDPRAKRIIRFREGVRLPVIKPQTRLQTEGGKIWTALQRPDDGFLTTDFELIEVVKNIDT